MRHAKKFFTIPMAIIALSLSGCANGDKIDHELNLPNDYYVEIMVAQDSQYGKVTTNYILSESSAGWIYMRFGYDHEQYVYMPLSKDKFIEYKYDTNLKAYKATMISDALQ